MRSLLGRAVLLAAALAVSAPADARAQHGVGCDFAGNESLPHDYQGRLSPLMSGGGVEEASAALGTQYANVWFQDRVQGWVIGVAPGPLSLTEARAAIVGRLQARFPSDQGAELIERLHVSAQPYPYAPLRELQDEVFARLIAANWSIGLTVGVGCTLSDGFRVEVWLFNDSTPEIQSQARAMLAEYGDRVRFVVREGGPPVAQGGPAPGRPPAPRVASPRLSDFVAMASAKRCVRGTSVRVRALAARRGALAAVTVRARGRRVTAGPARLARPLTVALGKRPTEVSVSIRLRDGRRATRVATFNRCR